MTIALLSSSPQYSEASQIIPTVNGVIQTLNSQASLIGTTPTSWKNTVIGGDFTTNPWQRTTSITGVSNTLTYTADRFWALGGASSSITVAKVTSALPPGFGAVAQFGRASANADTATIKFGQVFTNDNSLPYQGQPFVLSFYAKAGANFSGTTLTVNVATGTGTNESAANFAAASWTGYSTVTLTGSAGTTITTITPTTSWARYVAAGVIPTSATQIGFNFAYAPTGTAGSADNVLFAGIQFEKMPQGGVTPSPFEFRQVGTEVSLCQRYCYVLNEASATTIPQAVGWAEGTTTARFIIPAPVTMRAIPTITVTAGTFKVLKSSGVAQTATLTAEAASGSVQGATAKATADSASLTAGNATFLVGGGGTGLVTLSAEL